MAQFRSLQLPARSRELVTLVVAELGRCAFVWAQHEPMSQAAGIGPHVRELIAQRHFDSPELTAHDRALLAFAAAVVSGPRVGDDVFAAARRFLSAREIVEVVQVCGYYWTFGRVCTVLDVEPTTIHG
jgi:alkylhydroperoxidase family enzyme